MATENQAKSNKFNLKMILIILVIAIALIIGIIVSFSIACRPYDKTNNQYKTIEIKEDYKVEDVADALKSKGIIGNKSKFIKLTKLLVHGKSYQAGKYYLSPAINFRNIAFTMINGISTNDGFELPAGYTINQTAEAIEQAGFCTKNEFLQAAEEIDFSSYDFIDNDIEGAAKLEGFLLPNKYTIGENISAPMLIMSMLNEFDNVFTEEYRARADELEMSIRDVVILASIIEKETSIQKEKPLIAAVIHNKLNLGMSFDNGYPTAPLCSPSMESIKAALYPEDNENVYYVHSDKLDGSHVFTADKNEFKQLELAYRAAIKEKKAADKESDK